MRRLLLNGLLSSAAVMLAVTLSLTQVHGREATKATDKAKASAEAKVDINTASQAELEKLPGIGAATAKKIIAGRPYVSTADLSKAGVSAKTITKITPLVAVGTAPAAAPAAVQKMAIPRDKTKAESKAAAGAKVDINSASQAELEKLPGVGAATAKKIIAGRPYASTADLSKAGVSAKTITKITPLVAVGAAPSAAPATMPKMSVPKASVPATPTAPAAAKAAKQVQPPPAGSGMVWVNPDSKIYHKAGSQWYGKTKQGSYMTEAEAVKGGYRESKQGGK